MSGSAVDISVASLADGSELDRGAPCLELSALTPMGSPFVSRAARYGLVDFDPASGRVRPVADTLEPLNSPEELLAPG